jgi:hypothetical protein
MGLAELDRFDIKATAPDGRVQWIMVAGVGWPVADEGELILQFLLKLAMYERHAARQVQRPIIELTSTDEPPVCVLEIIARRGHVATVGVTACVPARGRPSAFVLGQDGWPDIAALQAANAAAFATRHGLPSPAHVDHLDALDAVVLRRHTELQPADDETEPNFIDGKMIVLAGAYAGEAMLRAVGGSWCFDPSIALLQTLHIVTADGSKVDVLGQIARCLRNGPVDAVTSLASSVVRSARGR